MSSINSLWLALVISTFILWSGIVAVPPNLGSLGFNRETIPANSTKCYDLSRILTEKSGVPSKIEREVSDSIIHQIRVILRKNFTKYKPEDQASKQWEYLQSKCEIYIDEILPNPVKKSNSSVKSGDIPLIKGKKTILPGFKRGMVRVLRMMLFPSLQETDPALFSLLRAKSSDVPEHVEDSARLVQRLRWLFSSGFKLNPLTYNKVHLSDTAYNTLFQVLKSENELCRIYSKRKGTNTHDVMIWILVTILKPLKEIRSELMNRSRV